MPSIRRNLVAAAMGVVLALAVMAAFGVWLDDVVNSPLAKRHVYGYYKLHRWIDRQSEISEMEHAWNPLGHRT